MNSKGLLRRKVVYLETALLESESVVQGLLSEIEKLQKVIESYKESDDPKDLEQNNDMVLDLIKLRLDKGARDYHRQIPIIPADDINRDNFYEAVEESLDLSVYLAAYMLRLMEEKERREFEPTTADEHNMDIPGSLNHPKERVNNGQEEAKKEGTT
mgnify:CR=1 FL=1|tara:strand:- start:367 stop:837 length:471 start_codon:yes stop_codon:yes gene_type:complete